MINTTGTNNEGVYARWLDFIGEQLIAQVEVEIGGQRIDRQFGDWMHIWNQLTLPSDQKRGYLRMIGHTTQLNYITDPSFANVSGPCAASGGPAQVCAPRNALPETTLYVPLLFWFNRNPGLALPLIALQYHEVKINIDFRPIGECLWAVKTLSGAVTGTLSVTNAYQSSLVAASLYVDYVFLDTDERRKMAQNPHEYLIEQLQFTGADSITSSGDSMKSIRMNFNHPCKELVWVIKPDVSSTTADVVAAPYWNNFTDRTTDNQYILSSNPVTKAKIQLNGNDRFAERNGTYFNLVQPYQHHEYTPDVFHNGINVYSFAIKPEEHQPSGTLNMSRIDTAVLSLASSVNGTIYIYTVNYNVLRILSGMGGLAYSN
jgi:hypothetical protein